MEIPFNNDHYYYFAQQIRRFRGKKVLDIGARMTRNMVYPLLKESGYEKITIVEIEKANTIQLRKNLPAEIEVICSDILKCDFKEDVFDTVVWWHGPVDVGQDSFKNILPKLKTWSKKSLIIGCVSSSEWTPEFFESLGFSVAHLKKPDNVNIIFASMEFSKNMDAEKENIGIVTTWFDRGASYVSRAFMQTLKEKYNVWIYARGGELQGSGEWLADNATWQGSRIGEAGTGIDEDTFLGWLKRFKISKIIFNEQRDLGIFQKIKEYEKIAYVDYYTKDEGSTPLSSFEVYDKLICCTKRHFSVMYEKYKEKAKYVPWGADIHTFQPYSKPSELEGKLVFFHNAGLWGFGNRKGTDLVLQAWKAVSPNAQEAVLLIHSQLQPPEQAKLVDRVLWKVGSVPHPGYYGTADVYVYPSRLEGIGLSVCEALASGLPIITTDNPPMNEFVSDGFNGKLVKVERSFQREDKYYWDQVEPDLKSLTAQMLFFIQNKSILNQMKINARKSAEQEFNWEENGKRLLEVV